LEQALFINIDTTQLAKFGKMFGDSTTFNASSNSDLPKLEFVNATNTNLKFAPLLHHACTLFLDQPDINPQMLIAPALIDFEVVLENNLNVHESKLFEKSGLAQTVDSKSLFYGGLIATIIAKLPPLIPPCLYPACQSLLAINQATTRSTRLANTSIKIPNTLVKNSTRYVVLKLEIL
jgi:hypothetical protein